jgi:hypothetical protein
MLRISISSIIRCSVARLVFLKSSRKLHNGVHSVVEAIEEELRPVLPHIFLQFAVK